MQIISIPLLQLGQEPLTAQSIAVAWVARCHPPVGTPFQYPVEKSRVAQTDPMPLPSEGADRQVLWRL